MSRRLLKSSVSSSVSEEEGEPPEEELLQEKDIRATITRSRSSSSSNTDYDNLVLEDLEIIQTIGTGSFSRVLLSRVEESGEYGALKVLGLADLVRLKQVEHVKNEKRILTSIQHPFIINMRWCYRDEYNIYMLFEFLPGGELFSHLRARGSFDSSTSRFYACELVLALEYLHDRDIVYRDVKPENILLDREGHLKIVDFGFAKKFKGRSWTICGTPDYLAPELLQGEGSSKATDWWSLGVLVYELLHGFAPFYQEESLSTYDKILAGVLEWPEEEVDPVAKDLIIRLLNTDPEKRLGPTKVGSAEGVKGHGWFQGVVWADVLDKKVETPFQPVVGWAGDVSNFAEYSDDSNWRMTPLPSSQLALFDDF